MTQAQSILLRFAGALEAEAGARTQVQKDAASDELIEVFGDIEQYALETADLLRHLLSADPCDAK